MLRLFRFAQTVGGQLLAIMLAVVLPLAGLIAFLIFQAAEDNRKAALQRLEEVTRDVLNAVTDLYRQSDWVLSQLAQRPVIRQLNPAACAGEMAALRRVRREFLNVTVWTAAGVPVCSALPLPRDVLVEHGNPESLRGLNTEGTTAGNVFTGRFSHQLVVVLSHPLFDAEGKRLGVVAVTVGLQYFDELLMGMKLPPSFAAAILDGAGTFVARVPHGERYRGVPLTQTRAATEALVRTQGRARMAGADGVERMYVFRTMPETGWKMFAGIDEDLLFSEYRRRIAKSIGFTALVLLASLFLAFLISRKIRRPLRALANAAEAVARGKRGARANVSETGEIAVVSQQFDRMLDSLAAYEASLEEASRKLRDLSARVMRSAEEERGRIARELHDEIGQSLTALDMDLAGLARERVMDPARIAHSRQVVAHLLDQVRDLSLDLRPSQLDDLGLVAALEAHLERHLRGGGLQVHFDARVQEDRLTGDLETASFRICQEALTNVVRHAGARNVWIDLRGDDRQLMLSVLDDGPGFDPALALEAAAAGRSSGLRNMLDRAALAGGRLEIVSKPGAGTSIVAHLPLR